MLNLKKSIVGLLLVSSSVFAEGTYENIFFINNDLKSGTQYSNSRYDFEGPKFFNMGSGFDKKSMTYIKPNNYNWTKEKNGKSTDDVLNFPNTTNYAYLKQVKVGNGDKDEVALIQDETMKNKYKIVFASGNCLGENCLLTESIISVVIPSRYKILTYQGIKMNNDDTNDIIKNANVKQVKNTLTLYAKNIQGSALILEIQDRLSSSSIYNNVSTSMKKYTDVKVETKDNQTKITLPMDNVFDSGSAVAKAKGKEWIATLVKSIKGKNYKEIRVEGHTDNSPINSVNFPSNWELSAARASDTVRFMIDNGVKPNKISAVGYGDTRPLVDNKTDVNKAKNRRIEITIVGDFNK